MMGRMFYRLLTMVMLCAGTVGAQIHHSKPIKASPSLPQEGIDQQLPPAVAAQVKLLYLNAGQQNRALEKLGGMGKDAVPAIPYILDLCKGQEERPRLAGQKAKTIGSVASETLAAVAKQAPKAFLPFLDDVDSPNLSFVIQSVVGCAEPEVLQRVLKVSESPDETVRQEAGRALVLFYGLPVHPEITQRVDEMLRQDPSSLVKLAILKAVPERGPTPAGDPCEALIMAALKDTDNRVKDRAFHEYRGTPSPELFQAVLATLDQNLCSPTEKHRFLVAHVKEMVPLLMKQLEDKDENVRQRAYLVLYHYTRDVPDEYLDRLFNDPSEGVRKQVLRHVFRADEVVRELRGRKVFLHAGCYYLLGAKELKPLRGHWDARKPRAAEIRIAQRILAGTDTDLINTALAAERNRAHLLDAASLHKAFANPATRSNAVYCLSPAEFTVDEMLLALELKELPVLREVVDKLSRCEHEDPRLLASAILLAGREPKLSGAALGAGMKHREKHATLLVEQMFATARPELRSIACEVVVNVLPKEQAREILLKRRNDPSPELREQVEALLRRVPPGDQAAVGIGAPTTFELGRAFDYHAWSYRDPRFLAGTVNPTETLPEDPAALALLYWAYWRRPDPKRDTERRLPDDVAQKILPLLQGDDPGISDATAAVFLLGHCAKYARETVSYMVYHSPRNLPLEHAALLGEAAAEPLTALAMHHPEKELRYEARKALEKLLEVVHPNRREALPTFLQKCFIVLMLEGEHAEDRCWAVGQSHNLMPEDVHQAVCRELLELRDEELEPTVRRFMGKRKASDIALQGPQAEEILAWATSPSYAERQAAAFRAHILWDDRLRAAMFVLLGDRESRVQRAAAEAISRRLASDQEVAKRLEAMLASGDRKEQHRALCVAVAFPESSSGMPQSLLQAVRSLAGSSHAEIRLEVTQALQPRRSPEDRELLRRFLKDPNRAVALAAHARLADGEEPRRVIQKPVP